MLKKSTSIIALCLLVIFIVAIGGAYATFNYSIEMPYPFQKDFSLTVENFSYVPGSSEMVSGEVAVAEKFVEELNKSLTTNEQTELESYIEERKNKGSSWLPINELAADDPAAEGLRELLGIDLYPELTVIIKFLSGVPAYELYTTRVDVDETDENGEYVIPESEFQSETTFVYPVNRTTFQVLADGTYVANQVSVGYSRAIYYYETPTQQSTTRTYDVSAWAEGISFNTAITMEADIVGEEITVQNIDSQKEVYFAFSVGGWSGAPTGRYTFETDVQGLTATWYNSSYTNVTGNNLTGSGFGGSTYYLKLSYTAPEGQEPQDFKFTFAP